MPTANFLEGSVQNCGRTKGTKDRQKGRPFRFYIIHVHVYTLCKVAVFIDHCVLHSGL